MVDAAQRGLRKRARGPGGKAGPKKKPDTKFLRQMIESRQRQPWTAERVLALGRSYQSGAVLLAAAELDLFTQLHSAPQTASQLATELRCDLRGLRLLLNALVALELAEKSEESYALSPSLGPLLTSKADQSVLAMSQHQANCLRNWAQLAKVVKNGQPAERLPSVRGEVCDQQAFIEAMHDVSAPNADQVIASLRALRFTRLLDIGGASGTWTIAFLRAYPEAKATVFDLPHVIPLAEHRLSAAGLSARFELVAGDFFTDALPAGADLAWLSAVVHQNSRAQNQLLFANVLRALAPGGQLAIRDIVMDPTHTKPVAGALFAINMLVATPGGATFSFDELREDLEKVGFQGTTLLRSDEGMNSVVVAQKPA